MLRNVRVTFCYYASLSSLFQNETEKCPFDFSKTVYDKLFLPSACDKPLSKFTAKSALEKDNRISTYLTISLHTFDNNP